MTVDSGWAGGLISDEKDQSADCGTNYKEKPKIWKKFPTQGHATLVFF